MIKIQSKFALPPQSMCEHQSSQDGRYGWFLCLAHEESSLDLEEIQAEVKLEILNAKVLDISKMEVESWLKSFFADFHWKLHASLRRTNLSEKGLSLFFAVCYDHEVYFVQFGRVFCAVTKGSKLETVGKNWKNYHVQTLRDLNLLGLLEEDIRVKPQKFRLEENESLVVLPGKVATQVFGNLADVASLQALVESFSTASPALWLILKHQTSLQKSKKRRFTKLELSALFLLLGTALAIAYMAMGNRIFGVGLDRINKVVTDKLQQTISKSSLFSQNVQLVQKWNLELPYEVTATPAFNLQQFFVASGKQVCAYESASSKQLWARSFEAPVTSILTTVVGLQLTLADGSTVGLDDNGDPAWTQSLNALSGQPVSPGGIEITPALDKQVSKSVTVLPLKKSIAVLDTNQGTLLSELKFDRELRYLSPYDVYNRCFYVVTGNTLFCVDLKTGN